MNLTPEQRFHLVSAADCCFDCVEEEWGNTYAANPSARRLTLNQVEGLLLTASCCGACLGSEIDLLEDTP